LNGNDEQQRIGGGAKVEPRSHGRPERFEEDDVDNEVDGSVEYLERVTHVNQIEGQFTTRRVLIVIDDLDELRR